MRRGARRLRSNLVRPTLIGMPAPVPPGEPVPVSHAVDLVEVPRGAPGVEVARQVISSLLAAGHEGGQRAVALIADAAVAGPLLHPEEPLEDPRTALILLTSGSTGDPKGVCWSRENLLSMSSMWRSRYPDLIDAPRVAALPVTSAGGLGLVIRAVLDSSPLVAVPTIGGAGRFDPEVFADTVRPWADTGPVVSLVPTQLAVLMQHSAGRQALRVMRRVFLGGAAAPTRLLSDARDLGIDLVTTYGMTETCGGCVHDGAPLDGVDVSVDSGGRIHLAGPMCALGYRLRPEETAAAFTGTSFATGDVGAWDGQLLNVVGRIDDIVQVRGTNVALGAVERTIIDSGLAREAVAFAVDDDVDGHRIIALVVPDTEHGASEEWVAAIRSAVRQRLGSPAVPASIRPVSVLPYLPGGKIDRRSARSMLAGETDREIRSIDDEGI